MEGAGSRRGDAGVSLALGILRSIRCCRLTVSAERITREGFSVQRAHPLSLAFYPGGGIRCIKRHRLTLDGQQLLDLVSDNRDVLAEDAHLHIAQRELMQRPSAGLQHSCESVAGDARDTLGSRNDASVVGETHRCRHVSVLDRLPVLLLAIQQLRFDGSFWHARPCQSPEIDWLRITPSSSYASEQQQTPLHSGRYRFGARRDSELVE